ncbi:MULTISPECIES: response regulator [unclassified Mesorhizobium]|jgi:CheY-like chemotaxis protein|uniref:response regulator n=1 Tax=unclassified Mesorhizobium TaxID=325217 RepID=UPI000FE3CAA1|nr:MULTISPECIES: response regulator [unclassified Mesorhizobium]MDG4892310.1 response regulator [Mesorhizobium sp. WSM4976]RWH69394.1 MAG: response regulator [Mesorhizobium sp.]RWL27881.1 MAG: response regulator [Mesorhizobium sp.]RWL29190.1 MAG: response regulator [Mesorhizobium sp.]RWL37218.1 MAG: response regulator [Mesorhizobium sp.]
MNTDTLLSGLKVLVVEDVFMLAQDLADQLSGAGCTVIGPVPTVQQALDQADSTALDGAVLDVNLRGDRSFPLAEQLARDGVPFIFLTGYDSVTVFPDQFRDAQKLTKPVDYKMLVEAVSRFRKGDPASG